MKHFIISRKWQKAAILFFWLLIWQLLSLGIPRLLFAGPTDVFFSLCLLIKDWEFWQAIAFSFGKIAAGFLLAFLLGNLLAVIASRFAALKLLFFPLLQMMKAMPVASFIIVALIWVSSANVSILIAFIVAFPISYINMAEGIECLDWRLEEMADVFRVPLKKRTAALYFPQLFPFLAGGLKVSAAMCWKAGIAGEIIGLPKHSIGENLYLAKLYLNTADLFAWTLVIILLSILFEKAVIFLLGRIEVKLKGRML